MEWECAEGHRWKTTVDHIKHGKTWCPFCADNKLDIEEFQKIAEDRGGKLVTEKYINNHTPMLWECAEGHRWEAVASSIKYSNTWCPHCAGQTKLHIEDLKQLAIERGGKLISKEYINVKTTMLWECAEGHRWEAVIGSVKYRNTWCPSCQTSKSENLFRDTIERMTEEKFPSCYPEWLVNPKTGYKLQLDGFCEHLQMAFEYQGEQHYHVKEYFHRDEAALIAQRERDLAKREQCKARGIWLITVPYLIKPDQFEDWIRLMALEQRDKPIVSKLAKMEDKLLI